MRKLLLATLAFFLFACAPAPLGTPTPEIIKFASEAVVSLEFKENSFGGDFPGGPRAFCSGIVIAKNHVLTNRHCVEAALPDRTIWVRFRDGTLVKAQHIVRTPAPDDAAIIIVDTSNARAVAQVRNRPLQVGEAVFAVGMPLGQRWTVTRGIISYIDRTLDLDDETAVNISRGPWIQTDAPINGGNSGGALFDADGYLIGVVTLRAGSADGMGYARPVQLLLALLKGQATS